MALPRAALAALPPAVATFLSLGCGPSVQSIYEGNVRFEHCYRLDLDVDVVPSHRELCWRRWLARYTYGQPRDRIEYARRRVRAFSRGDMTRPTLDLRPRGEGAPPKTEERPLAPRDPHAPPPSVAPEGGAGAAGDEPASDGGAPRERELPGAACAEACAGAFRTCRAPCDDPEPGPGFRAETPTCAGCTTDYKACMRRCFE
ncbi:MAG TPA: hypothetical protein VKY73_05455 [Polyangiaceae bacterium]|nr:hypothetical protein [Polyangiaceae bacterium]